MNQDSDAVIELVGVVAALLLAFLVAGSDAAMRAQLALLLIIAAWIGIAAGLSWMAVQAKRAIVRAWSELLDGVAVETK